MSEKVSSADIADFAAFSSALSFGTAQMNKLSTGFAIASTLSDTLASQLRRLSTYATSMMSLCQAITTCCQCQERAPTERGSTSWQNLETADRIFVLSTAVIAGLKLWTEAAKWLWRAVVKPIGTTAIGWVLVPMWRAVAASEALAVVTETAGELAAALAVLAGSPAIVLTATAALIAAVAYVVWRNWNAIVKVIGRLTAAVSREVLSAIGKLASVVVGPENGAPQDFESAEKATSRVRPSSGLRAFAPATVASFAAKALPITPPSFRTIEPSQIWGGLVAGRLSARRAVATAMLAAPLLVAPAMAKMAPDRSTTQESSVSMVFNSTPTIVSNGCHSDGIEHRIEEALRRHREAIYVEWSRELQRRQRTEF